MRQLGLNFKFPYTRLYEAQKATEAFFGDAASLFHQGDFNIRLDGAQLVHQGREAAVLVQGKALLTLANEAGIAGFDDDFGAQVLIAIEIYVLAFGH